MRGLPALLRAVPAPLRRVGRHRMLRRPRGHQAEGPRGVVCVPVYGQATLRSLAMGLPPELLRRALTHSSWVDARTGSYERLEFLGDSVLGLAIASALYERFPEREEGGLARLKAVIVSRASCVQVATKIDLASLVLIYAPASERKRRDVIRNPGILGDMLEAVIGAVYLHYGFERVRPVVMAAFEGQMEYALTAHVDHKTALQELLAPRGLQPVYRLSGETGPAHARVFTSEVLVDGAARGRGTGTTIKMSEQAAAQEALLSLEVSDD